MITDAQRAAGRELLTDILSACRPEEVVLVDHNIDFQAGNRASQAGRGMMGFGVEAGVLLLMPFAAVFLKDLATTAVTEIAKKWGKAIAGWIAGRPSGALSADDLVDVRQEFHRRLLKAGFNTKESTKAADALVVTLVRRADLVRTLVATDARG